MFNVAPNVAWFAPVSPVPLASFAELRGTVDRYAFVSVDLMMSAETAASLRLARMDGLRDERHAMTGRQRRRARKTRQTRRS